MTTSPDRSKQVAHVLLDMLAAFDPNAAGTVNVRAIQTAFPRLEEVGAVSTNYDATTDILDLDIGPLLDGFGFLTNLLIQATTERTGVDRETIIHLLRESVDDAL